MRTIAIVSGKGGVGKTTIAVNLCASLSKVFNKNSILIDANLNKADASLQLGFTDYSLALNDAIKGSCNIFESMYTLPTGMKFIPSSLRDEKINIKNLKGKIRKLNADYVIIDSASGMGKEAMFAMNAADEILIVTTPDIPAVKDALRVITLAKNLRKNIIGIALNKVTGEKYELSVKEIEMMCDVQVIQIIPEDVKINESIAKEMPVILYNPNCDISFEMKKLAAKISGETFVQPKLSFFQRVFKIDLFLTLL